MASHLPARSARRPGVTNEPAKNPETPLRRRVLERVQRSVALHREYTTVRHNAVPAAGVAPGVVGQALWRGPAMRVARLTLDGGAELPWSDDAQGQELLLLRGALDALPAGGAPMRLGPQGYGVRGRTAGTTLRAAEPGTEVYLRERCLGLERLPEMEARWWRLAQERSRFRPGDGRRWTAVSPGVEVSALCGDREVVSMLVRFAPGASVPDHHHALDEDCYVLDGEMFLGDILLRPGDYQLAPAGGGHWGETSDVGVLFFFHGWLDPVLTGRA